MKNQKSNMLFILIVIVVAVIIAVYLLQQRPKVSNPYSTDQSTNGQAINNADDLDKTLDELDSIDVDQYGTIDQGVSENSSDASSF